MEGVTAVAQKPQINPSYGAMDHMGHIWSTGYELDNPALNYVQVLSYKSISILA